MKKKNAQRIPLLLLMAGSALLILAVAVFLLRNESSRATPPSPAASGHEEETYPEIERVSLEEAKVALDSGTAVFVDVRGADAYAMSHIPGSVSIPLAEVESRLSELDPNQWIVTYCT